MQRNFFLFLIFGIVASLSSNVSAAPYRLLKEQSSIKFFISLSGENIKGEFKDYAITMDFDPDHPENTRAEGQVRLSDKTITAENTQVQQEIAHPAWLNTVKFPVATFKVSGLEQATPNNYKAFGTLTLLGKTLPLEAYVLVSGKDDSRTADVTVLIDRLKYGIGIGEWATKKPLYNMVTVYAHLVTVKDGAANTHTSAAQGKK